jgi:hypothetical protein
MEFGPAMSALRVTVPKLVLEFRRSRPTLRYQNFVHTVVFPKEGQLAERHAIKHGLWLRQIGRRYALRSKKLFWSFAAQSLRYALHSQAVKSCLRVSLLKGSVMRYAVKTCFGVSPLRCSVTLHAIKLRQLSSALQAWCDGRN